LAAGRYYLLLDEFAKAETALRNSLQLNPQIPARYYLAYAYAKQNKYDDARSVLRSISSADPKFARAQELLRTIASRRTSSVSTVNHAGTNGHWNLAYAEGYCPLAVAPAAATIIRREVAQAA
jgi:cytochrome c-type biogenesis protein CcmH/NrfG